MIPIKLSFQAFGPYVKKQEVDFQKFSDAGVFLIHGITGSGKTTILDAMSYALYGKSSGGQRGDITAMRCQLAGENVPTEVEFIFKISSKTYRFTRTINIRTKRNGSKEYNVSQNAMFLSKEDTFVPFFENPKIKDIEQKACELVGLNHEQFIQVIMLPQGKFEKLLMAKSEEKEQILVTLFNAEKWQEAAEWICNEARNISRDIILKRENINVLLKSEQANSLEDLEKQTDELSILLNDSIQEKDIKQEILKQEKERYQLQKELFNLFEEKNKLEKELLVIKEKEAAITILQDKLEKGKKALNVSQKYNLLMNMHKQLKEAAQKLEIEEKNNKECLDNNKAYEIQLSELKKNELHIEKLKESKIKAEQLIEVYKDISKAKLDAENETKTLNKLSQEANSKQELYNKSKELLNKITEKKEYIFNNYSIRLPELKEKSERFAILEKKELEIRLVNDETIKIKKQLDILNKNLDGINKTLLLKKQEYDVAYNKYIESSAYIISESLTDGKECPVCGSIHHPKKALRAHEGVDIAVVKALSEELEQLNKEANELINLISKQDVLLNSKHDKNMELQKEHNSLADSLKEISKNDLTRLLEKAEAEVNKLENIIAEEKKLTTTISNLDKDLAQLNSSLSEQTRLNEEKLAKYKSLCQRKLDSIESDTELIVIIDAYKKEIDKYNDDINKLTDKSNNAKRLLSSSDARLKFLVEDLKTKNDEYELGKTEYYELLEKNNFKDTQELKAYLVEQEIIDRWDKEIQDYIIEKSTVTKNLDKLIKLTESLEQPDVNKLIVYVNELEKIILELEKQIALYKAKKERLEKIFIKTQKEQAVLVEMIKKYDTYNSFGITLRGDKGISLRRYVLGVMLASVTQEANRLLKNVHDGRYQLCRTIEGAGRARKVGLDLEVHDAYSGEKRSVAGLSGGEKFLVSLALSLGLSAVVQAQAGGIKIDTMFIDEGFGSLDNSSIADALNILSSVKGSKRLVGIISHVQLLKETIETNISVKKDRYGSSLVINS